MIYDNLFFEIVSVSKYSAPLVQDYFWLGCTLPSQKKKNGTTSKLMMRIRMMWQLSQSCQCASLIILEKWNHRWLGCLGHPMAFLGAILVHPILLDDAKRHFEPVGVGNTMHQSVHHVVCREVFFECNRLSMKNWVHLFGKQEASQKNFNL